MVVPSIFHLATERDTALVLMQQIERLGTKLMIVPANKMAGLVGLNTGSCDLLDALVEHGEPLPYSHRNGINP